MLAEKLSIAIARAYPKGRRSSQSHVRPYTVMLLTALWLAPLLMAGTWVSTQAAHRTIGSKADTTLVTSGTPPWAEWEHAATTTEPQFSMPPTSVMTLATDQLFVPYYITHAGASLLGSALTPALPTAIGTVQFFAFGALLQPNSLAQARLNQPVTSTHSAASRQESLPLVFGPTTLEILRDGSYDRTSNVVRLSLFHALLSAGSTLPLSGDTATLRYVDLRGALQPAHLVSQPAESTVDPQTRVRTFSAVFIAEGRKGSTPVGHIVPDAFWDYLMRSDVASRGWATEIGQPLTEALHVIAESGGTAHHLTVQAFSNAVLVADTDAIDAARQPAVRLLDVGRAYLETFGPPDIAVSAGEPVWSIGDTAVLDAPAAQTAIAHIGQAFKFTLTGNSQWVNGSLWYSVHWQAVRRVGNGWVNAAALTFTSPGAGPAWASFDVLSPDLAHYLASQGQNAAAVVYDITRNQYYAYNANGQFTVASSVKVPLMLTLLTMIEDQGRGPSDQEMGLLTAMIENSDNDAAQAIWVEIGGASGLDGFMQRVGISGLSSNPDAWGWSTVSPLAMVRLLAALQQGKILNAGDRALALNLMHNVESDQQIGVGDTAPQGASVALKDGWVPAPDGLWAMNTSGIVTVGGETYIISVYTQHENSLDDSWNITRTVCADVAKALI